MRMKLQSRKLAARDKRDQLVRGLGWFSIGLGLAEFVAPRLVCRFIGVKPRSGLVRLLGVREIASGIGLLSQPEKGPWLKSRVAGDAMDLGLMGMGFLDEETNVDVDNSGSVSFQRAPGGRGTIVRVDLRYRPPAGKTGATVAKFLGQSPEKQITVDLLRFKQMVETGEIARTEGQPAGRARSTSRKFDDVLRS